MHALFFEVTPKPGHEDHYFNIAAALKPRLEKNDGLLFLDRYRSRLRTDTILSYQHWRDEAVLVNWREDVKHAMAQKAGREVHFADYRITIAEIVQWFVREGSETPDIQQKASRTSDMADPRFRVAVESIGEAFARGEQFESVNFEDRFVSLLHVANEAEGSEIMRDVAAQDFVTGARLCLVSRDYGMFDRDEAPQNFAPVKEIDGR
jgi:heme-degrading monooxygenase HmoA